MQDEKFLGSGRSADVYLVEDDNVKVARKIFTSSTLADLLHIVFFGAPNPYGWCQDAITAAYYRRRILHKLLRFWFGSKLTIANAIDWGYDSDKNAYYLDTQFVKGDKAKFATPFSESLPTEIEAIKSYMHELDLHLDKAGFVGARWQAGYGQPCAYANFLIRRGCETNQLVWIDAESAVPQIAASNLSAQVTFYIPEFKKRRKPLFDDVDCDKLYQYLIEVQNELRDIFETEEVLELFDDFNQLEKAETTWRSQGRIQTNLAYYSKTHSLCEFVKEYYQRCPNEWSLVMNRLAILEIANLAKTNLPKLVRKVAAKLNPMPYLQLMRPSRRRELATNFLNKGVAEWQEDNRFSQDEAINEERAGLISRDVGKNPYMADFGAHLSIWMLGKFATILLALAGFGVLLVTGHELSTDEKWWIAFATLWGDSAARFAYSLIRGIIDKLSGRVFPWAAVILSPIKWLGYFAYTIQMIITARGEHESEFLVYLLCSYLASKIPIYGGENSGAEYRMNKLGWSLIKAPIWLILALGYSMLTIPILLLFWITAPLPNISLSGIVLAVAVGIYAWARINRHR